MKWLNRVYEWLNRVYAVFWRATSGRPWTYEIRQWTDRHPLWAGLIIAGLTVACIIGHCVRRESPTGESSE